VRRGCLIGLLRKAGKIGIDKVLPNELRMGSNL
jgi:hypothetical protein